MRHRTWIIAVLILTFASSGLTAWAAPATAPASEQSSSTESSAPAASSSSEVTSASSSDSASSSTDSSNTQTTGKKTTPTTVTSMAAGDPNPTFFKTPSANIDPQSASASYSINIEVPPGRGGIQPNPTLVYNSNGRTDFLGVGWQMDMLSIERSIRRGTPKYTSSDKYALAQNGSQQELLFDSVDSTYRTEIEGGFSRLQLSSGSWVMTDKKGTKYFFGTTQASQVYDPATPANVFAWNLDKVQDINGNYMTITYLRDGNQLYPQRIDYTGNGSIATYAHVDFIYDAVNRPDIMTGMSSGFKITTNKRLQSIEVRAGTNLIRRYDITYLTSVTTGRSLLKDITQIGSDGTSALPKTIFTYSQTPYDLNPVQNLSVTPFRDIKYGGVMFMDMNADGLIDIVELSPTTGSYRTYINRGNGVFDSPVATANTPTVWAQDQNARLLDLNGDGLMDVIYGPGGSCTVWLNGGSNSFQNPKTVTCPSHSFSTGNAVTFIDMNNDGYPDLLDTYGGTHQIYMNDKTGSFTAAVNATNNPAIAITPDDTNVKFLDMNGDGLLDFYYADTNKRVWVNNGVNGWNAPITLTNVPGVSSDLFTAVDMNGDGLTDLVETSAAGNVDYKIYFNTGKNDFDLSVTATPSPQRALTEQHLKWVDLNGDHLTDVLLGDNPGIWTVWINNGRNGFQAPTNLTNHHSYVESGNIMLTDLNGDNQTDLLWGTPDLPTYVGWFAQSNTLSPQTDILTGVDNSVGGLSQITYGGLLMANLTGAQYKVCFSPFLINAAKRMDTSDSLGHNYFMVYKRYNPVWSFSSREFRGFGEVQVWDSDNNFSVTNYLQDDIFKGRESSSQIFMNGTTVFSQKSNTWDKQLIHNVSNFVFLKRTDDYLWDGDGVGPRTASEYFYEEPAQAGNLTRTINYGEVDQATGNDTGTDKFSVEVTYHNNTGGANYLVGLPKTTVTKDNAGTVIHQNWFFYDNLNDLTTLPTKGNLTKKEDWNGNAQGSALNPKTQYSYDVYGNLKTTTDPKGNVTTINYDATTQLFPLTTLNALTHTLTNEYYGVNGVALDSGNGYRGLWGELKSTTDPNLQKGSRAYDVFGRVTAVVSPQDTIAFPTSSKEYAFTSQYVKLTSHERVTSGQAATLDAVQYYDGLGRLIQSKSPSATTGQYVVGGQTEYNLRGLPIKKYFPYFTTNDFNTIDPIDTNKPKTTLDYDPMGRAIKTTSPDGTYASMIYDDWTLSSIDENGHKQKSYSDAFGRLIKKEEYRGADGRGAPTYPALAFTVYATTLYTYDTDGNLITTQDQNGNNTIISYDKLGRKISMNDPDMKNWQYVYDLNGNLTSQTDAKNQTINFTYDALNRLKTKTSTTGGLNVTYTYDDAAVLYSKGRLTKAQYPTDQTEFKYDTIGREIQSIKKINSVSFDVQRNYDALNRLVTLQYPKQTKLSYTYNPAGQINGVAMNTPITFDAASSMQATGKTSVTLAHTVTSSGSNRALVVGVTMRHTGFTAPTITSLKYGGVNMTQIARKVNNLTTRQNVSEEWYLLNPPTGLNNIVANFSASVTSVAVGAMSMTNVKQVAPEASNTASGTSTSASVSVTPLTSNAWVTNIVAVDNIPTVTVGAGQTQFYNVKSSIFHVGAGSYKAVATPALTTMNWTLSTSRAWSTVAAVFAPIADAPLVTNVEYNAMGQVTRVTYANGTVTTNTYNPVSFRLTRVNTVNGATALQDLNYTYDPAGDILTITDNSPGGTATQSFQYDELNRLTFAGNQNYGTKNYSYDAIGNITSKDGKSYTYMQNGAGPHAVTLLSDGTNFQYDLNGNMITKVEAGNTYQYSYDVENRLTNVKKNGVNIADYSYDGDGGRVKKTIYSPSTVTTTYVGSLYEETSGTGINFVYLGDTRIASIDTTGKLLYYLSDHLGGSNVITDSTGVKKELTEYDPYGQYSRHDKYGSSQEVAAFYFTGKKLDDETGLYYYGGRYYDPKLGRFITPDTIVQNPAHSQTFNRYSYCGNNPVNNIDPTGHSFWKAVKKFFQKWGDFISPLGRAIVTGDWKNFGFQVLNIATAVFAPNPFIFAAGFLSYTSRATANIGDNASFEISKVLGYAGTAAGVIGTGIEIKDIIASKSTTPQTNQINKNTLNSSNTIEQTTSANEVLSKEVAASIGNKSINIDSADMTLNIGKINQAKFLTLKTEVYGSVGSSSTQVLKAGISTSAVQFKTISPYSEALLSFDKMTLSGGISKVGTLGISGEISAEVVNAKTAIELGSLGGTKFTIETSAGWGAKFKGSLAVGKEGGEAGLGGGFGPTGSLTVKWMKAPD